MSDSRTLKRRLQDGRELRNKAARRAHAAIGNVRRDPIRLLEASSAGRVERLVPLGYGRMLASPYAFYRGTAIIQAHDLAGTPRSGLVQQICGDCHLMNFGGYATPERNLLFDINDFDETHPGPWEWDLKRLAASFMVAARHLGFKPGTAADIVYSTVKSYQRQMAQYAGMGALDLWYDRITYERILGWLKRAADRALLKERIARAAQRTHGSLLPKIAEKVGGRWRMKDAPPGLFHIHGGNSLFGAGDDWVKLGTWGAIFEKLYDEYRFTLSPSHRQLLGYFRVQDMAFKVVGVGSVGTRCLVILLADVQENPLFLQVKEARPSVLASHVPGRAAWAHQGQRVVAGQRLMQASSDYLLGWATGPSGRHFYVRQLRDMKTSADLESFEARQVGLYARLCGWVLARGHARAGGLALEISGYLGEGDAFADAIVRYAGAYADQVERDFDRFRKACRSGRLQARSEEEFAADFRL
jgi:uncharacterized protein (DUF2252 family)